jgi:hypothetical protein
MSKISLEIANSVLNTVPESKLEKSNFKWEKSEVKWESSALPSPNSGIRSLFVTWNMKGLPSPDDISDLLLLETPHHLYVISSQECLRSILVSIFYSSKRNWEEKIIATLGSDYYLVISEALGATHLMIVAHVSLKDLIAQPRIDTVTTGLFNLLPNKGGIGASLTIGTKRILVIGCHLASGETKVKERNADFMTIETGLELGDKNIQFVSDRFDCAILVGDLNYRITGNSDIIRRFVGEGERWMLMKRDELMHEMSNGNTAIGYKEGTISFPPTYKLKGSNYSKNRIPSWTDRIIFKDKSKTLIQESYGSIVSNRYSDHTPVFSQFTIYL